MLASMRHHYEDVPAPSVDPGPPGPRGVVRTSARMMLDDRGPRNFLTTTLMWSAFGYRSERERLLANLDWCQKKGLDGIRTLGSVMGKSWAGRTIDPRWPDYELNLGGMIDAAFERGLRQLPLTVLGDHYEIDPFDVIAKVIRVCTGREEKIGYFEVANEFGHAVKISSEVLLECGKRLRAAFPQHLIALSRPEAGKADAMKAMMRKVGGPLIFPRHTAREESDRGWRQARQPYDFTSDEWTCSNQEPPGPASSVGELWKPRQLGAMRWLSHAAGCGVFCHHTGNGVRGTHDPANNRQPNLWEVKGIDEQYAALHMVERWLPDGIQNWKVENNGRDDKHPLQLPDGLGDGFWEGGGDVEKGDVNKNYSVLGPDGRFMVCLAGLNSSGRSGQALYDMQLEAFDSLTGKREFDGKLAKNQWLFLPGRADREMSYIIVGQRQ